MIISDTLKLAQIKHEVYSTLLSKCRLERRHQNDLIKKRGLKLGQIEILGYATYPDPTRLTEIADELLNIFGSDKLSAVPGFYVDELDGKWRIGGVQGLAIPARNIEGKIQAIKIRTDGDKKDGGGKYLSLSSKDKPCGTSPGVCVHLPAVKSNFDISRIVRVTEGEVKADIATLLSGTKTISIPGVNSWGLSLPVLENLKPKKVLIALDADSATNPHVAEALRSLYFKLKESYAVAIETWRPDHGKGIDDVLKNGHPIQTFDSEKEQHEYLNSLAKPDAICFDEDERPTPFDLARLFLERSGLVAGDRIDLRHWNDTFFIREKNHFQEISDGGLQNK